MTTKEKAHRIIDSLPEKIDFEDIIHALHIHSKFIQGESEIQQGQGIDHKGAVKIMKSWQK